MNEHLASPVEEKVASVDRPQVHAQLDRLNQTVAELFKVQASVEERLAMLLVPEPTEDMLAVKDSISEEPWRISDQLREAANSLEAIRRRFDAILRRLEV